MMTGSNVSVMFSSQILHSYSFQGMLQVNHEQTFDLGEDLLITKPGSADRTRWTGRHASSTSLAKCRIDLGNHTVLMEEDGVEGAHIIADAAA